MQPYSMTSIETRIRQHRSANKDTARFAVLLPLIERNGRVHVLFEVRSKHLRRQPGDTCFPGGKVDAEDADERAAAIRETCEELTLRPQDIRVIGSLDDVIDTLQSVIHPFVGVISEHASVRPNPDEVGDVFYVPLEHLLAQDPERYDIKLKPEPPDDFPYHLLPVRTLLPVEIASDHGVFLPL